MSSRWVRRILLITAVTAGMVLLGARCASYGLLSAP